MMKTTNKQHQVIKRLTAYTSFHYPVDKAIEAFFNHTDRGISSYQVIQDLNADEKREFQDLLAAHAIQSKNPSSLLEGLWIEDMQVGLVLMDYIRDGLDDSQVWFRKIPAFRRAYDLHMKMNGRLAGMLPTKRQKTMKKLLEEISNGL